MTGLRSDIFKRLMAGTVIPAHPLALDSRRKLDERRQRALTRYYLASGAGGVAVGVHSTQFQIRKPEVGLYEPVLRLAAEEVERHSGSEPVIRVAGLVGPTEQAVGEAEIAAECGYDLGLLSAGGLSDWSEEQLLERTRQVARILPVFGFYLQPAVGGRELSYGFWRRFFEIDGVYAAKVACFDRYRTLDVMRAAEDAERRDEIALYTGNDDAIVSDLLTSFPVGTGAAGGESAGGSAAEPGAHRGGGRRFVGGLLGQWAVWTRRAVELLERVKRIRTEGRIPHELLTEGAQLTDANGAIFDAHNGFAGCIAGIHEVLRRQGLLEGTWCIDPDETMSRGQAKEIERVCSAYPHLSDDDFVEERREQWLSG